MSFIAGILTVFLVINCILLVLLILMQLPKKDAGVGLAFGGGAADALFGAGSGNVLTKVTKWATVVFFVLALFLGYLQDQLHNRNSAAAFEKQLQQKQSQMPISVPPPATPPASQPAAAPANN
jgi:preprotein translocase subunit SecG